MGCLVYFYSFANFPMSLALVWVYTGVLCWPPHNVYSIEHLPYDNCSRNYEPTMRLWGITNSLSSLFHKLTNNPTKSSPPSFCLVKIALSESPR